MDSNFYSVQFYALVVKRTVMTHSLCNIDWKILLYLKIPT